GGGHTAVYYEVSGTSEVRSLTARRGRARFRLHTSDFRLQTSDFRLRWIFSLPFTPAGLFSRQNCDRRAPSWQRQKAWTRGLTPTTRCSDSRVKAPTCF